MKGRGAPIAMLVLFSGCRSAAPLPELPAADLAKAPVAVRQTIETAGNAARAHPGDAAAVGSYGMVLHAHQQTGAAGQAYQRAAALDPSNADYPYYAGVLAAGEGKYAEAVTALRTSLGLREYVPARLRLADALYAMGRRDEARREYESLLHADPNLATAQYGLGRCLQGELAAAALRRAIELFPRYGAARFALAAVYRQMGKTKEAEAALDGYETDRLTVPPLPDPAMAAVQALDRSVGGMMRAARALEGEGRLAEAAAMEESVLAADPDQTQAWVNLISIYARLEMDSKAETAYRQAIARQPGNAAAYYNFGVLCARRERMADAESAFRLAVRNDPAHAEALDNLGAVVETAGKWDEAAALYRKAIALKPGLRLAQYHLGRILVNQRRPAEAIAHFERAVEGTPDAQTPAYLYALGATLSRTSGRDRAIEVLRRAGAEAARLGQGELQASIARDIAALETRR